MRTGCNSFSRPLRLPVTGAVVAPAALLALLALLALAGPALGQPAAERALVVFGSSVRADGSPSPSLLRRLRTTLREARRDPGALIVVSGGAAAGPAEGPFMARWLRERGVAPGRLLVEGRARHTGENADLSAPLLRQAGVRSVTVVTERFHVRRARFHMRAALKAQGLTGIEVGARAAPDGLRGARRLGRWLTESAKIARDAAFRRWPGAPAARPATSARPPAARGGGGWSGGSGTRSRR